MIKGMPKAKRPTGHGMAGEKKMARMSEQMCRPMKKHGMKHAG